MLDVSGYLSTTSTRGFRRSAAPSPASKVSWSTVSGTIWSKASPCPNVQISSLPAVRKFGKSQRPMAHRSRGLLLTASVSPGPLACWSKSIWKNPEVLPPRVSGPCNARFSRVRRAKARNTSRLPLLPPPGAAVFGSSAELTDSPTGVSLCWTFRRSEPPRWILKSGPE